MTARYPNRFDHPNQTVITMSVRVGVLGATGAVGQRLIQLIDPHPEFELAAVTASKTSVVHCLGLSTADRR